MLKRHAVIVLLMLACAVGAVSAISSSLERWLRDLESGDPLVRAEAVCRIGDMGSRGSSAIPALVDLLADDVAFRTTKRSGCLGEHGFWGDRERTVGEEAAGALADIGKESFEPLVRALNGASWVARKNAALALGSLEDRRAVPPLVARLADETPKVREQSAWALGALEAREAEGDSGHGSR